MEKLMGTKELIEKLKKYLMASCDEILSSDIANDIIIYIEQEGEEREIIDKITDIANRRVYPFADDTERLEYIIEIIEERK